MCNCVFVHVLETEEEDNWKSPSVWPKTHFTNNEFLQLLANKVANYCHSVLNQIGVVVVGKNPSIVTLLESIVDTTCTNIYSFCCECTSST